MTGNRTGKTTSAISLLAIPGSQREEIDGERAVSETAISKTDYGLPYGRGSLFLDSI